MGLFTRRPPAPSAEDIATIAAEAASKAVTDTLVKAGMISSLPAGAARSAADQVAAMSADGRPTGAFTPLPRVAPMVMFDPGRPLVPAPLDPLGPTGRTEPRIFQYPTSTNLQIGNAGREVPFTVLRQVAGVDMVRRCVEIRKADIVGMHWAISLSDDAIDDVMLSSGERNRAKAAKLARDKHQDEIAMLSGFWEKPDRENGLTFSAWLALVLEEMLVLDALSIYPVPTLGRGASAGPGLPKGVHSLRIIDGSTIKPLLNHVGGIPQPPQPAYQQILYGFPRGEYVYSDEADDEWTSDRLIYRPKNRRTTSPYGLPPVEQALPLIDLWMKRAEWLRAEYSVGVSGAQFLLPEGESATWSPEQRRMYEEAINADMGGQTAARHQWRLLPPGFTPHDMPEHAEKYKADWDDFLLTKLASFFDVMPTQLGIVPKSGLGGKGHQEGEQKKAETQARRPTLEWLTDLINDINVLFLGGSKATTIKFWSEDEDDIAELTEARSKALLSGQTTLNDIAAETGRPLYDFAEADEPFVQTGNSITFLRDAMQRTASVSDGVPETGLGQNPTDPNADPTIKPEPSDGPAVDDAATAAKVAEAAAFKRWAAKRTGKTGRDFVWKHHSPVEVKTLEADLGKASAPWPGHELLDRLIEHYAPLVQAALARAIRPHELAAAWAGLHLTKAANPEDLTAAVDFLAEHPLDTSAVGELLTMLYEDGWTAGLHAGAKELAGTVSGDVNDLTAGMDWSRWTPGNPTLAQRLLDEDSGRSLRQLLDRADVTLRGLTDTTVDRVAGVLAQGLSEGLGVDAVAGLLGDVLDDPDRAELIANTETARAMTAGALDSYSLNGVEMFDVLVFDPCDVCADEAAANPHPLDDDAPPYHPSCRCAAAPVVGEQEQQGE